MIRAKPKILVESIDDAVDLPYSSTTLPSWLLDLRNKTDKLVAMNISTYTYDSEKIG